MKFEEFKNAIEKAYYQEFPQSAIKVNAYKSFGRYITIDCYLAKDETECHHGIIRNDLLNICYSIKLNDNFDFESEELPQVLRIEAWHNQYKIKPSNEYLYCEHKKATTLRKSDKEVSKMIEYITKQFKVLRQNLIDSLKSDELLDNNGTSYNTGSSKSDRELVIEKLERI